MVVAKRAGGKIDAGAVHASLIAFSAVQTGSSCDVISRPAFNYDYGGSRLFHVKIAPVQIGPLPEWARMSGTYTRTEVPIFSMLSKIDLGLDREARINPFSSASGFNWLLKNDANLVLLGVPVARLTFIHHVEEMAGGPFYRYVKPFPGTIRAPGKDRACKKAMHMRPIGACLDYDYHRLEVDLIRNGLLIVDQDAPGFVTNRARKFLQYWGNRLSEDPLYLLDPQSRETFAVAAESGTCRVQLEEYENVWK